MAPTPASYQETYEVPDPSSQVTVAPGDSPDARVPQDEDKDLDRVPGNPPSTDPASEPRTAAIQRIYLENSATKGTARGGLLVPPPTPDEAALQGQLFLDVRRAWRLADKLNLTLSDRFTLRAERGLPFPSHENLVNDWREGYLSWEAMDELFLDFGRINLKSGVALGFNPTDFFKTRSVVEPLSSDPTVLREDRLGSVMARAQRVWAKGALMMVFAPALHAATPVYRNNTLKSFDPSLDRTNEHNRTLVKGNVELIDHWAPEFLIYRDGSQTALGVNATQSLGQRAIGYLEWAGGKRSSLLYEGLSYGRKTGTLPPNGANTLPIDSTIRFRSDLALGASYTTDSKVTLNLEYHYSQSGFSAGDWKNWFDAGPSQTGGSFVPAQLWYIRAYALEQQHPVSRHYIFLRADRTDAFVRNLEITGFVNTNARDASAWAQVTAEYYLSNEWTIGGLVMASLGGRRSEFGSEAEVGTLLFKLARYF